MLTGNTSKSFLGLDIEKAASNINAEAFLLQAYNTYSPAIHSNILQIVQDKEKAAKVLLLTFVEARKNLELVSNKETNLFIWLFNVSRNMSIEFLIENNCRNRVNAIIKNVSIDNRALGLFLVKLPLIEKAILSLIYFRNFSLKEIAELLKLPPKLVETKLQIAKQKLQTEYPQAA